MEQSRKARGMRCFFIGHNLKIWAKQAGGLTGRIWEYSKCKRCGKQFAGPEKDI